MAASEDETKEESCKKEVKNEDKAVQCNGFCNKLVHIKCCGISDAKYKKIQELSKTIMFMWLFSDCGGSTSNNKIKSN